MGATVHHDAAGPADPFPAVVIEGDGIFAFNDEPLVQHVEHLEERHVRTDVVEIVGDETTLRLRVRLTPDVQSEFHHL
jgi:hypothetical protein